MKFPPLSLAAALDIYVYIIVFFATKGLYFFVTRKAWESTVVKDSENGKLSSGRSVERRTRSAAAASASRYPHFVPFRTDRRSYRKFRIHDVLPIYSCLCQLYRTISTLVGSIIRVQSKVLPHFDGIPLHFPLNELCVKYY